jgi:ribonuclease HI
MRYYPVPARVTATTVSKSVIYRHRHAYRRRCAVFLSLGPPIDRPSDTIHLPLDLSCASPTFARLDTNYLLFFDGGSRGNPGRGGSGSIIVRVTSTGMNAHVVWSAAMSLADPSTTNNGAEYGGLVIGLRAAKEYQWSPLEVIGDSQLIISQMKGYRPPVKDSLRKLYAVARRTADTLGVHRWHHHPRAANAMADAAANLAMDQAASSQVHHPTERPDHQAITAWLDGDVAYWRQSFLT